VSRSGLLVVIYLLLFILPVCVRSHIAHHLELSWHDVVHFLYTEVSFVFRRFRKIATSDYLRHVPPSMCPHGATRLPQDGFSLNLIFACFSEICREN
jgi:hypothetical protein